MDFILRPAAASDIDAILAIYNHAVATTTASYDLTPQSREARAAWFHEHQTLALPILVAESADGEVVGWASLSRFREKEGYRYTVENSIYIAEEARGQGVGKALLAALIEEARRLQIHMIVAGVDSQAEVSLRMHEKAGFVRTAYMPEVGYKFGRWLDVVFLQLKL